MSFRSSLLSCLLSVLFVMTSLVACSPVQQQAGTNAATLTLGLPYIPNIQFAPFYVADTLGYYSHAGVHVVLRHHAFSEDEFGAMSTGKEDVIFAGGDELLQARDHHVPLVDVVNLYAKYPIGLIVPASSAVHSLSDLRGKTIGIPGPYGESYFGLLALLQSAGFSTNDVRIQTIGFTQVSALAGGKVDAVMGYLNNDLVLLQQAHIPVRAFALSDVVRPLPLVSNGLGVSANELEKHAHEIKALIMGTLQGYQYVHEHPEQALSISKKYVPGLEDPRKSAVALAVLRASIPLWQDGTSSSYAFEPATWQAMTSFMLAHHFISQPQDAAKAYSNSYLPT